MDGLKKVADITCQTVKALSLLMLGAMIVAGFSQVVLRYVLHSPIPWAEELIRYLFVWITLLGGAMAVRSKGHLAMDLLVSKLPPRLGVSCAFIGSVLSGGVLIFLSVSGAELALNNSSQISDAMGMAMSIPYMAIPVGTVLMLFFLVEALVQAVRALLRPARSGS